MSSVADRSGLHREGFIGKVMKMGDRLTIAGDESGLRGGLVASFTAIVARYRSPKRLENGGDSPTFVGMHALSRKT